MSKSWMLDQWKVGGGGIIVAPYKHSQACHWAFMISDNLILIIHRLWKYVDVAWQCRSPAIKSAGYLQNADHCALKNNYRKLVHWHNSEFQQRRIIYSINMALYRSGLPWQWLCNPGVIRGAHQGRTVQIICR